MTAYTLNGTNAGLFMVVLPLTEYVKYIALAAPNPEQPCVRRKRLWGKSEVPYLRLCENLVRRLSLLYFVPYPAHTSLLTRVRLRTSRA